MARPLGREHIRVNAVAPGNISFDGSVWARRLVDDPYAVETMLRDETALGRLGTPDEVAEVTLFLASEHARFTTGSVWTLDGGQSRSN
jgi:NAD(P)-dependent dehydrogenase (short-subunit alcohol dehydrogenase family)